MVGPACEVLQFCFIEVKCKAFSSSPLSEFLSAVLECRAVFLQGGGKQLVGIYHQHIQSDRVGCAESLV